MSQSFSLTAGASTALDAVNQSASALLAVIEELAGALDPRLQSLVKIVNAIHKSCIGADINKRQCLTLCSFCCEIVATIDKSVKAGLSLGDKTEYIDRLHRSLVETSKKVETISNAGKLKAHLQHKTIATTLRELRTDLTDAFSFFQISSSLALAAFAQAFLDAADRDREFIESVLAVFGNKLDAVDNKLDAVDNKLDDIKHALAPMSTTEAARHLQVQGRVVPSGSPWQAVIFAELLDVKRRTDDLSLPLGDLVDEAQKVGDSPVSEAFNGNSKLWRGIWLGDSSVGLALKFPRNPFRLSLNRVREFHRHVEIQRRLKHRNIIPLMGVKYKPVSDDKFAIEFVAFPWLEYGNVSSFLEKFPKADRLKLMFDVACGLKYLHDQSPPIVHRAIEPSHILVDAEETAIISGFSVAKALDSLESKTYTVSNGRQSSLRWMAPEVSKTKSFNTPADVYSWAMTTHTVFSGAEPFADTKAHGGVVIAVGKGDRPERPPQDPQDSSRWLTDEMWELLERCWHQDPEKRPTMRDVVNEIASTMRPDLCVI